MKYSTSGLQNAAIVLRVFAGVCALFAASACAPTGPESEQESLAKAQSPVVYGEDGRKDVLNHSDASLRKLAQTSTVTAMRRTAVDQSNPSNVTFASEVYGDIIGVSLCSDQPFRSDPSVGFCSGTLIDDDLVLTAGHCMTGGNIPACDQQAWVFNFSKQANGTLSTVTSDDVFNCAEVMVQRYDGDEHEDIDYAIIRLDRSARPRFTPAPVRAQRTPLDAGQRLALIGSPHGIPVKIDTSGAVRDPGPLGGFKFTATTDSFQANSGSGIYETDSYQLAGILVAGEADYVPRNGGCKVVKTCSESGCRGEDITHVWQPLDAFCANNSYYAVCKHRKEQTFFTQSTNAAQQNTQNHLVFLQPGQTIDFGTCIVPGSAGNFNTQLRLYSPAGIQVAENDDGGGSCGERSRATYTVPALKGGLFELRAGCAAASTCYGTVAYTVNGPGGGVLTYDGANTASATTGTRNVDVTLRVGETLIAGTCGVEQAHANGDTFLRLFSGATQVAYNDDIPSISNCGNASRITFSATSTGTYQLRAGCYSSGTCSANLSYVIVPSGVYSYSGVNTNYATQNTINTSVRLELGDVIQVGTCGLPGASAVGDTYLRLYNEINLGTQVMSNDDACGGLASQLTYTATAAGTYQIQSGCYSAQTCQGVTAYKVQRKGSGSGSFTYTASQTKGATVNYTRHSLFLREGQSVTVGTCGVTGSTGTGDTFLGLYGPDGFQAILNDDGEGCGSQLSKLNFVVPADKEGAYEIRGGCSGDTSCAGTVVYRE